MKTLLFLLLSIVAFADQDPLKRLVEGNKRYMNKESIEQKRESLVSQQTPFAIIVGCSDSRVPPELIFDQHIGDLFVIRVAGNVVGPVEMDSIEYAADVVKVPLILVLGHESCGAVKAVLDGTAKGDIENIAPLIQPAIDQTKNLPGDRLENAIKANVRLVMQSLKKNAILSPLFKKGKLKMIGGYYRLDTGAVELL